MTKFRILPGRIFFSSGDAHPSNRPQLSLTRRFCADRSGNFAIMAAIAIIPLLAAVGIAVDVTMAMNMQTRLQQAADSAALVLARESTPPTPQQAREMATAMLDGNFKGLYSGLEVTREGAEWTIAADATSPNHFMQMFTGKGTDMHVVAKAAHSTMSYEIALVLDTTGSMEGKKLGNLKEAATSMVETMSKDLEEKERVKFALVPFSTFVNVGPQLAPTVYRNGKGKIKQRDDGAAWLDRDGVTTATGAEIIKGVSRFTLFYHLDIPWEGCVETRQPTASKAYDTQDLPASAGDPRSLFVPAFHIDDPDSGYSGNNWLDDNPSWTQVPNGLRPKMTKYGIPTNANGGIANGNWYKPDIDDSRTTIYGSAYREHKGPNFFCDSAPILPLTTDYRKVTDAVDGLYALGNTNVFEGLMWGWRVLSPSEPFSEGRPKDAFNNQKVIILLSDGNNTWNRLNNSLRSNYASFGFLAYERLLSANANDGQILSAMDAKTLEGCANAKADGITIYTIRLELEDSNSDGLLKACATSPEHYFDVPDAAELKETFEAIRYRISKIRLTK